MIIAYIFCVPEIYGNTYFYILFAMNNLKFEIHCGGKCLARKNVIVYISS